MPFQTGASTNYLDLLEDLQTFMLANGWVLEANKDAGGVRERYYRGPGSAADAPVHINIRTGSDAPNGIFYWEVRGAVSFDTLQPFETQPGGLNRATYFLLANVAINHWFHVSDRRVMLIGQISTSYMSMYAGFFLPFATPSEYPFPLYIGCSCRDPIIYTTSTSELRSFTDPGIEAAWLRRPDGVWDPVYNHGADATEDDYEPHSNVGYYCWPYYSGGGTSTGFGDLRNFDLRPPPGDADANIIVPVHIFGTNADQSSLGFLEEAYWLPGFGVGAEQTFNIASARAAGTLTTTANFANGDTVTIGTKVYAFQTVLTEADGNILIGASAAESLQHFQNAINLGLGAGIEYAAATTLNTDVFADSPSTTAIVVQARQAGTGANTVATTETSANASWGAATLQNGGATDNYVIFPNITRNNINHYFALKSV